MYRFVREHFLDRINVLDTSNDIAKLTRLSYDCSYNDVFHVTIFSGDQVGALGYLGQKSAERQGQLAKLALHRA